MSDDPTPDPEEQTGASEPVQTGASEPALGREIVERQRPLRARRSSVIGGRAHAGPGTLGRRSRSFSSAAGLSLSSRRALGLAIPQYAIDGLPVAPPAEFDDSMFGPERPRTGDATLDHIISQQRTKAPKATAPRRGLLSASARRSTRAGRDTGPGAAARRLSPVSGPAALDHQTRETVSGTGGDSRPRAPRRGPHPGGSGERSGSPGGRTGRRARGRLGRPAPWHEPQSAPSSPLLTPARGTDPLPVRGAAPDQALMEALAAASEPIGTAGTAEHAPREPARTADLVHDPSLESPPMPASERVAALAESVLGAAASGGPSGLGLPRGARALPPGLAPPRAHSTATAASPTSPAARMAERLASFPGSLTESLPVGPGAFPGVAGTGEPLTAQRLGSPRAVASARVAGAAPSAAVGSAPAPSSGLPVASPASGSTPRAAEPVLAAMLRSSPPSLSLSVPPSRAFSLPGSSLPGAFSPGAAQAGTPAAGARAPWATARSADLPVSPDRFVIPPTGAATVPAGSTPAGSTVRSGGRGPGTRGLGTVASIMAPPRSDAGDVASVSGFASTPRPGPGAVGGQTSLSGPTTRRRSGRPELAERDSARRTLRRLPDLGSVAPAMIALAPDGASGAAGAAGLRFDARPGSPSHRSSAVDAAGPAGIRLPDTSGAPTAPPAIPVDPGERFAEQLRQHRGPTLRRLPQRFEPIAKAILPRPERVRVSSGDASRKALAAVGKVAATAGDVVHLARPLDDSPKSVDILAHELTHVAHASPLVRFYDDDRAGHQHGKEEQLARQVGEIMAKAPVGTPPASPPMQGGSAGGSGGTGHESGGGSGGSNGQSPVNQVSSPPPAAPPGLLHPSGGQGLDEMLGRPQGEDAAGGTESESVASAVTAPIDIDRLLDALETRVIRELERRGRRWPRPM